MRSADVPVTNSRLGGSGAGAGLVGLVAVAALGMGLWRCSDQHALLLTVDATGLVQSFDLRVKDLATGAIVLDRKDERITTNADPNRDISVPGQELKLSVEFPGGGHYLVHIVGRGGVASGRLFVAVRDFRVGGVDKRRITLIPLENDEDGDRFPSCEAYTNCEVHQNALSCPYLDCDDRLEEGGASINPFAQERCGNGRDDDCSELCGAPPEQGDIGCTDNDGDGSPAGVDCDDDDPCRTPTVFDDDGMPVSSLEARNLCDYRGARFPVLSAACLEKLSEAGLEWTEPYCGDGVDQDCDGKDIACQIDEDCDGSPVPEDCDDADPSINPAAEDVCDGKDNDCDGTTDEGCNPCDVDGDGFSAIDSGAAGCDRPVDVVDYDSGIRPAEGPEGGTREGALRRFCSRDPDRDGRPQAEVDHDLDNIPAKDDGCAPAICDEDGDGFAREGCGDPPPTPDIADCSDDPDADPNAARIFPGAPDDCRDNVAQNCQSARTCEGDVDGDGYVAPDDCAEGDPERHPWAIEVCDGVDNDCDGLIDEGNPDHEGTLIATNAASCTDISEGECAPCLDGGLECERQDRRLTGLCVCSKQLPRRDADRPLDPAKRVSCSGEDDTLTPAQRCFVPPEFHPKAEECDPRDHDCDGVADDPDGSNLEDVSFGRACSIDLGTCVVGEVVGCDLSRELAYAALLRSTLGDEINVNWLCSSGTELPRPELCNGRDDDCNGTLPSSPRSADEVDTDGDGYLACGGCGDAAVSGAHALANGIKGCDDCDDNQGTINPGASEVCNDVDDDCDASTADGADECGGTATPDCCSSLKLCVDFQNDSEHCGNCTRSCTGADVDGCVGGECVCGALGRPCASGQNCEDGKCVCKRKRDGGVCSGCCDGNTCVPFNEQAVDQCGKDGSSCGGCGDGNSCTDDSCNLGECRQLDRAVGASCEDSSGRCSSKDPPECCKGCLDGAGRCKSGRTLAECEKGGADCKACVAAECKVASCSTGSCAPSASNISDGTRCDKDSYSCTAETCQTGVCRSSITTGCLISSTCYAENTLQGTTGDASCQACKSGTSTTAWTPLTGDGCASDGKSCTSDVCNAGKCEHPHDGGHTCLIGGTCYAAGERPNLTSCLECDPGRDRLAWSPVVCDDEQGCSTDSCVNGGCVHTHDGTVSCFIGGVCYASTDRPTLTSCVECDPGDNKLGWSPVDCSDGKDCSTDTCDANGNCVHTHDGSDDTCFIDDQCYSENQSKSGDDCQICKPTTSKVAWSPLTCDDSKPCTVNACKAVGGCDFSVIAAGYCKIFDACYASGVSATPIGCFKCDTARPTEWTPQTNQPCNDKGVCDAFGSCICSGCLRPDGSCATGNQNDACDTGGANCDNCVTASGVDYCDTAAKACACSGCVDDGGNCVTGDQNDACDTDGANCDNCVDLTGVDYCDTTAKACACSGCVDDGGNCVTGDQNDACDTGGVNCDNCVELTGVDYCDTTAKACACSGCLKGPEGSATCEVGDQNDACDIGEANCKDCTAIGGEICDVDANKCVPP